MEIWYWKFLVLLRFILTILPQTGYIHPDEYFQYPEVVSANIFGHQSFLTWEFTSLQPIRSVTFPYLIVGLPYLLLRAIGIEKWLGTTIFPLLLVILPRILMCCLSLIHDWCLYQLCVLTKKNHVHCMITFASSYVALIFYTRTFSNSVEAIFFTLLLYLITKETCTLFMVYTDIDKVTDIKKHRYCGYLLGLLIATGCFIRPTFLLFSVAPVMFWVKSVIQFTKLKFAWLKALLSVIPGVCLATTLLVIVDTLYYNDSFAMFIETGDMSLFFQNLVITPLNFLWYNVDNEELKSHGYHPRYLHVLVNIPLLFSILGVFGLMYNIRGLLPIFKVKNAHMNSVNSLMLTSFILPVLLLSVFPHQEPRFILPVLFPLVFLFSEHLFGGTKKNKVYGALWIMGNILGCFFFGFLHQGGLLPSLTYLHGVVSKCQGNEKMNLVFYHTYMPPRHILAVPQNKNVHVNDLLGSKETVLLSAIQDVLSDEETTSNLFVITPSTVSFDISSLNSTLFPLYKVELEKTFFPHFSSEDPPDLSIVRTVLMTNANILDKLLKIKDLFSLHLYKVITSSVPNKA